jgi:hypothetical protein
MTSFGARISESFSDRYILLNNKTCKEYSQENYPIQYLETDQLNRLGKIPFCSTASGFIRVCIGITQVVEGLARSCFFAYKRWLEEHGTKEENVDGSIRHFKDLTCVNLETAIHGGCNILRGLVEMVFLVGNALCYVHDRFHPLFPRIGYRHEIGKNEVTPLHLHKDLFGKNSPNRYFPTYDKNNEIIGIPGWSILGFDSNQEKQ